MNFMDAKDRYLTDPHFHAVVDQMVAMALNLDMSPGELRQAAVFAEIKFMTMRPAREMFPDFTQELEREILHQETRTSRKR